MINRISVADPETLAPEARELYALSPLRLFGVLAHAIDSYVPLMQYLLAQQRSPELPLRLKEMAILRVAALEDAEYEWVQHMPRAQAAGVSDAEIECLRTGVGLDAPEQSAIALVGELVRSAHPSEATVDAAHAALGVRGLVELTLLVANYMLVARVVGVAGLEPDPPTPQPSGS